MRIVTTLMDKVFSDSTPSTFGDELQAAIQKAMSEGSFSTEIDGVQYNFADCGDGSCVIEDKSNKNELTLAKSNAKGETVLEGVQPSVKSDSPTLKDVMSPRIAGEDSKGNLPAGSTQSDVDVTIEKTAGIVDPDKAGVGKALQSNYSLCIHGFDSEEEAQEFYSDLNEELESNINFSDEELDQIAFSATELNNDTERLMGTEDLQLAYSVLDRAEELKAYSVLAESAGHDMSDLIEACEIYSDYASEVIYDTIADTDVNDYFSELDEDEINDYFSELDEVTSEVLFSALEDEENYTFSEVQEIVDQVYSDIAEEEELSTPIVEAFSDFTEDELNEYFSQFNEIEQDIIFSAIEEDENVSFSEVNEMLADVSGDLNEIFSEATEDEIEEFCANYSEDELDVLQAMVEDDQTNYTFSDFLSYVEDNRTFSDDDLEIMAENMNQLYSAVEDMTEDDVNLAGAVLMYSEQFAEIADQMEAQGHDMSDVADMLYSFSESAAEVLDKNGVDPAAAIESAAKEAEKKEAPSKGTFEAVDTDKDGKVSKSEWEAAGLNKADFDKADKNKDGVISKDEYESYLGGDKAKAEAKAKEEPKKVAQKDKCGTTETKLNSDELGDQLDFSCFGDINEANGDQKLFSIQDSTESVNPCLDSPIN